MEVLKAAAKSKLEKPHCCYYINDRKRERRSEDSAIAH